jgi:Flp pilus assembly protein CpaB
MMLAGSAIAWKCRVQITILLSTTESEVLSASDAGQLSLYLRSVLDELGHTQHHTTIIFEDNRAAVLISQASHPTRQT